MVATSYIITTTEETLSSFSVGPDIIACINLHIRHLPSKRGSGGDVT